MVAFLDKLGEILVHLPLLLTLHICKSVRDDGNQQVEHNHDQEEGSEGEHEVDDGRAVRLLELVRLECAKHEFEHLHQRVDVGLNEDAVTLIVLSKNEEGAAEGENGHEEDDHEDFHVDEYFDDGLNQVTVHPKDSQEVEKSEADEE